MKREGKFLIEHNIFFSGTPLVLLPPNPNPLKYPVKAYAWLIMGVGCQLHYQIMIQGRTTTLSEPLNAYLTNSDGHINSPHTSENTSIMGNFYDNVVSRNQAFYYLVILQGMIIGPFQLGFNFRRPVLSLFPCVNLYI